MRKMCNITLFFVFLTVSNVIGCMDDEYEDIEMDVDNSQQELTSVEADFYNFEWDGWLIGTSGTPTENINEQIKWTTGQLNNSKNSAGYVNHVELTDIEVSGDRVDYHAKMLVAWGRKKVPSTFTFYLPKKTDKSDLTKFLNDHRYTCMNIEALVADVKVEDAWHYYNPASRFCRRNGNDIVALEAEISPNDNVTTGKYPEYNKIWEDDTLRILAIFGKEDVAAGWRDEGLVGFNVFVYQMNSLLKDYDLETIPDDLETDSRILPRAPAPEVIDVEFRAFLPDGRRVVVNTILVLGIEVADDAFFEKYESLTAAADFIAYNGHSGLGANIRTLVGKGKWVRDQYAIMFMNGCVTFSYINSELDEKHAEVNPDDPTGSLHFDMITNAMANYFESYPGDDVSIIRALMSYDDPKTYEQILKPIDGAQVAVVYNEEDNDYTPDSLGEEWTVEYEATSIAPETWQHYGPFDVKDDGLIKVYTGGTYDADLYVNEGSQASESNYDCASESNYSNEQCVLLGAGKYYVSIFAREPDNETNVDMTVTYHAADITDTDNDTDLDVNVDADADTENGLDCGCRLVGQQSGFSKTTLLELIFLLGKGGSHENHM
ncbi:MAG: hypothetical protein GY847_18805 [Proteobacteria bacterium]|nr:hypothetical protein [Pseudomonadota bacterium]